MASAAFPQLLGAVVSQPRTRSATAINQQKHGSSRSSRFWSGLSLFQNSSLSRGKLGVFCQKSRGWLQAHSLLGHSGNRSKTRYLDHFNN
jgi:hypothetical protein